MENIMRKTQLIFAIGLLLTACHSKNASPSLSVNGIWKSVGAGWVLEITDSTQYCFYDITSGSCLPYRSGAFREFSHQLSLTADTLSLLKGVITYDFIRTNQLPELCSTILAQEKAKDPLFNFEVFAETVKEHYAFMELNEINWESLYLTQKAKLNRNSSEVELYLVLEETLEKLKDNHAYLEANEEVYLELEKNVVPRQESSENGLPEYGDFQVAKRVSRHHLKEELTRDSWLIQWGKLTSNIGYIQVKAMWLYADLSIPQARIDEIGFVDAYVETFSKMYEGEFIQQEVAGVARVMDSVMKDLDKTEAMVIDTRFNGGGQDAVSFEILSRFMEGKTLIASQKLYYGNQFTREQPLYLQGRENAYTNPVYVLTSQQTGSAAEAFAIATLAADHIYRVGSPTSGAMSTALEKKLPNGWSFSISNEVYMDIHGNNYENKGIPVDYELNYPKDRQTFFRSVVNDLDADKHQILRAIDILKR